MQMRKQQSADHPAADRLGLPPERHLVAQLKALAAKEEAIALTLDALQSGTFRHPDGRTDDLRNVRLTLGEVGLLSYLARTCPKPLSIEIGFGMGSSASVILGTRRLARQPFAHLIFDPFWLPDERGKIVQSSCSGAGRRTASPGSRSTGWTCSRSAARPRSRSNGLGAARDRSSSSS